PSGSSTSPPMSATCADRSRTRPSSASNPGFSFPGAPKRSSFISFPPSTVTVPDSSYFAPLPARAEAGGAAKRAGRRASHLEHALAVHAAAIHLEVEIDHRRTIVVPGEPVAQRAAAPELLRQQRMHVVHGIELHSRDVAPAGLEQPHAPFHLAEDPARLLAQTVRADVAPAHEVRAVVAVALGHLGAAGDHERARRVGRRHRVGESMKARLPGRVDLGADVAARDRIALAVDDAPLAQHLDIRTIERAKALLGELPRRAQLAGTERGERPA